MTDTVDILKKIKTKGYWRIVVYPLTVKKDRIPTLDKCEEMIGNAVVSLRGWPYPYYNNESLRFQDYIQVEVDFEPHIELWRFYLSGLFVHYVSLNEDWMDYQSLSKQDSRFQRIKQGDILGLDLMVYDITEIFEFVSRLSRQGLYVDGLKVEMQLNNITNRELFIFDFKRAGFHMPYKTSAPKLIYPKEISEENALKNPQQNALEAILFFTDRFGWKNPNVISIQDMQQNLLQRRL